MKRIALLVVIFVMFAGTAFAQTGRTYYVEVIPTTTSYEQRVEDGVTFFTKSKEVSKKGDRMGFSGTSVCQVIDLGSPGFMGYLTFQFKALTGVTHEAPISGTSISAHWRVSNIDSPLAWSVANKNTLVSGINALTGATAVGYDLSNYTSGVTPHRYIRFEYESGISKESNGRGNLIPIGVLFVR